MAKAGTYTLVIYTEKDGQTFGLKRTDKIERTK